VTEQDHKHPLRPSLKETESKLKEALDDVCEETEVQAVKTDELIRIEEALEIAHQEAKRAVSLRRKIARDR
jgi:hypothetical protein